MFSSPFQPGHAQPTSLVDALADASSTPQRPNGGAAPLLLDLPGDGAHPRPRWRPEINHTPFQSLRLRHEQHDLGPEAFSLPDNLGSSSTHPQLFRKLGTSTRTPTGPQFALASRVIQRGDGRASPRKKADAVRRISFARFNSATFLSNFRISAGSPLETPDLTQASISERRIRLRTVSATTPTVSATDRVTPRWVS
jgi:hypothetical protein